MVWKNLDNEIARKHLPTRGGRILQQNQSLLFWHPTKEKGIKQLEWKAQTEKKRNKRKAPARKKWKGRRRGTVWTWQGAFETKGKLGHRADLGLRGRIGGQQIHANTLDSHVRLQNYNAANRVIVKLMPVIATSGSVKMAKSIANTNPPSCLTSACCMATAKGKCKWSVFGTLNLLLRFQLLKYCSVFLKSSDGLVNK